jgi:hypothetical protein
MMTGEYLMSDIKIDKNVPLPEVTYLPPIPLDKMKVGDSILLKKLTERNKAAIRQRITRYQNSHYPKQFAMRQVDGKTGARQLLSVRVFRMKDAYNKSMHG